MSIQPVNVSFGRRIKMDAITKSLKNELKDYTDRTLANASVTSLSAGLTGASLTHTAGLGINAIGTALSAKAMGTESSGFVPAVIGALAQNATPASAAATHAHPSTMGSFFSTVGEALCQTAEKIEKKIHDPS